MVFLQRQRKRHTECHRVKSERRQQRRIDDHANRRRCLSDAIVLTEGHDIEDVYFQTVARPIASMAAEAFIGPCVSVGNAVLGARGCAFRDLDPWTVCAGNPARALRPPRRIQFPEDEQPPG